MIKILEKKLFILIASLLISLIISGCGKKSMPIPIENLTQNENS